MSQAAELNHYENNSSSIIQNETEFSVSDETPRGEGGRLDLVMGGYVPRRPYSVEGGVCMKTKPR